jgi:sulfotransferase family protein
VWPRDGMADTGVAVVGAGLGRTGTNSLKLALEHLLGRPCYHMLEVFERQPDVAVWHAALRGQAVDWQALLGGFGATVDWPACSFWKQISAAQTDPWILLSTRSSADVWWESFSATIAAGLQKQVPPDRPDWAERRAMVLEMLDATFTPGWREREAAMAAYERHNDEVRATAPADRLIDWQPGDGWNPLCRALGVAVPDEPFPRTNSRAEFVAEQHAPD